MYISTIEQLPELNGNTFGVDLEYSNKKICLVQISSEDGSVFLLDPLGMDLKEYLTRFFQNDAVKVFYAGQQDQKWLYDEYGIIVTNYCDLKVLAMKESDNSLIALWAKYCGVDFPKEHKKRLQVSDWHGRPLSNEQLNYAALDCKYLTQLRTILLAQFTNEELGNMVFAQAQEQQLPRTHQNILMRLKKLNLQGVDIEELSSRIYQHVKHNAEFDYNNLDADSKSKVDILIQSIKQKKLTQSKKEHKHQRFLQYQEKYTSNKQIYSNSKIISKSGVQLCFCDQKKIEWYLKMDLATKIDDNSIQLKFEPQVEYDQEEMQFYNTQRTSQCVVCGASQNYLKYQVVPYCYKHYFNVSYKSHRAHDVVVLCARCHEKASAKQDKQKQEIAIMYNVPLQSYGPEKEVHQLLCYVIKKIQNLAKHNKQMEISDNYTKLSKLIFEFNQLQLPEIPNLEQLIELRDDVQKQLKNSHGQLVVEQLKTDEQVEEFIKIFRRHFMQTMDPQFLPPSWAVDHKLKRQFGQNSVFYQQQ